MSSGYDKETREKFITMQLEAAETWIDVLGFNPNNRYGALAIIFFSGAAREQDFSIVFTSSGISTEVDFIPLVDVETHESTYVTEPSFDRLPDYIVTKCKWLFEIAKTIE